MVVLHNHRVRPFLKEGKSISDECNLIKDTKIHRWASFVKSRGLGSKALDCVGLPLPHLPLIRKLF